VKDGETKEGLKKYKNIIKNANKFYKNYMNMDLMADYMYWTINNIVTRSN
jgi:hypothetical protein